MQELASYTQYGNDGEAGCDTVIYPKWIDGKRITKKQALEASGMHYEGNTTMGAVQKATPTVTSAKYSLVVEQTWIANV